MKTFMVRSNLVIAMLLFAGIAFAQKTETSISNQKPPTMKTYVIERDIPGAGKLTAEQLKSISQTSCSVLKEMGPRIKWVHSYVTGDKIFCIYEAENEALIRDHAKKGGFPANSIYETATIISPATAE